MNRLQQLVRRGCWAGAAAGLMFLATGCETVERYSLTHKLWNNGDLTDYSEPAPQSHLELLSAQAGSDVLVQYDALSEKHSLIKGRAYFLKPNRTRISAGKRPKFVDSAVSRGMNPIPILDCGSAITNSASGIVCYRVKGEGGLEFRLYRNGDPQSTNELPVYVESFGTTTRVVLTPFAVAGDTVMVGMVTCVMGFFVWLHIGAPGANS